MATVKVVDNIPQTLIASAQTVTGSWVNLGSVVDCRDCLALSLFLKFTLNDAANVRIRMLGKRTAADAELWTQALLTAGAADVKVEGHLIEFNVDADTAMVFMFDVKDVLPFVQFQVQAGTAGSTGASVTIAQVSQSSPQKSN